MVRIARRLTASVGLRAESTGCPICFNADAVAVAKRDLHEGDTLDGEGGYTVRGLLMPACISVQSGALPLGLAHRLPVQRPVARGSIIRWSDVRIDGGSPAVRLRKELLPSS